ncbi:DJ-1/PfpI family protein [Streptomyces sp. HMX112]|uniref:DJ-1/PfpI family protein n=1 Tax=Streptomyces sp. HMX112 TaxID=3390850 RepID=UPI003A80143C
MPPAPHRVVIVAFPGVDLLDVTGPAEVFSVASGNVGTDRPRYRVQIAAPRAGELPTSSGVRLVADLALREVRGRVDTLLVPGAINLVDGGVEPVIDTAVVDWLRTAVPQARRAASVCAGAHVLPEVAAASGLGSVETLHRAFRRRLATTPAEYRRRFRSPPVPGAFPDGPASAPGRTPAP